MERKGRASTTCRCHPIGTALLGTCPVARMNSSGLATGLARLQYVGARSLARHDALRSQAAPLQIGSSPLTRWHTLCRESSTSVAASAGQVPDGAKRKSVAALGGFTYPGPRKLKDIVKLPLLNAHGAGKVTEIWSEYHKHHATAIADACSEEEFGLLMQRSKRCPLFVVPIPRWVLILYIFTLVACVWFEGLGS